ncbi:thymidylate kinase [Paenibacillus sp. NAIST15-1]|nr:thymidylate kinase [Paenibacillus sp. NAIST15-1]
MAEGYKVVKSEHHRYDTPTGQLIMDWLTRKYDVDQRTIELIMTADKQAQQSWYQQLEQDGVEVLILDRYMLSQLAYSKAAGVDLEWSLQLQKYMRKSDIDFVIDIPPDESMRRKGKHNNGVNDKYESDYKLLSNVQNNYIHLPIEHTSKEKYIVNGMQTIEEIHDEIYSIVKIHLEDYEKENRN